MHIGDMQNFLYSVWLISSSKSIHVVQWQNFILLKDQIISIHGVYVS